MSLILMIFFYLSAMVFVVACIARILMYAKTPIHLRWELYPVPHEESEKVKHGGSYFEDVNWWQRPRKKNLIGELSAMIPEMLFMKGLWEYNRGLWFLSFPFHFGLYLLCGSGALLLLCAIISLFAPNFQSSGVFGILRAIYVPVGVAGLVLALLGAMLLLVRRLGDSALRIYTTKMDIFNLVFFIVTFALLGVSLLSNGAGQAGPLSLLVGVLSFNTKINLSPLFGVSFILLSLLIAYVPLTHMSHFIGKYFTYHAVRWNDEPNLPNSELEKEVAKMLTLRPTWSAQHIAGDGQKTWADIAMTNPTK